MIRVAEWMHAGLVSALIAGLAACSPSQPAPETSTETQSRPAPADTQDRDRLLDRARNDDAPSDETLAAARNADARAYIEQLQAALPDLDGFNAREHTGSLTEIDAVADRIADWVRLVDIGSNRILSADQQAIRSDFANRLAALQRRSFPILRDAFGPRFRVENTGTEASTLGAGYRRVSFLNRDFRNDRQLLFFHSSVRQQLIRLRFREARYRWNEFGDQFQAYDLTVPRDGELVVWTDAIEYRPARLN